MLFSISIITSIISMVIAYIALVNKREWLWYFRVAIWMLDCYTNAVCMVMSFNSFQIYYKKTCGKCCDYRSGYFCRYICSCCFKKDSTDSRIDVKKDESASEDGCILFCCQCCADETRIVDMCLYHGSRYVCCCRNKEANEHVDNIGRDIEDGGTKKERPNQTNSVEQNNTVCSPPTTNFME